eukprot:UN08402
MIVGGSKGRMLIQSKWVENKFIFADSYAPSIIENKFDTLNKQNKHNKRKIYLDPNNPDLCVISTGFTSLISTPSLTVNELKALQLNVTKTKERLSPKPFAGFPSNFLPQTYVNNIANWKNRKYNLFFMGQADGRDAYELRRIGLNTLNYSQSNVLIQTSQNLSIW